MLIDVFWFLMSFQIPLMLQPTKDRARKPKKSSTPQGISLVDEGHADRPRAITASLDRPPRDTTPPSPVIFENSGTSTIVLEPPQANIPRTVTPSSTRPALSSVETSLSSPPSPLVDRSTTIWVDQAPSRASHFVPKSPSPPNISPTLSQSNGSEINSATVSSASSADVSEKSESPRAPVPVRHSRIPSTGTRATVMDIAQSLQEEHMRQESSDEQLTPSPTPPPPVGEPEPETFSLPLYEPLPSPQRSPLIGSRRNITPPTVNAERRRSNYEKYASIILPPLAEESTPTPSPVVTLSKSTGQSEQEELLLNGIHAAQDIHDGLSNTGTLADTEIQDLKPGNQDAIYIGASGCMFSVCQLTLFFRSCRRALSTCGHRSASSSEGSVVHPRPKRTNRFC